MTIPLLLLAGSVAAAPAPVRVPYADVLEAIRASSGYNRLATTNGARLQSEALLRLARRAQERSADGPPLLVRHDDWFHALLEVTGISAEQAPIYAVLPFRHGQDIVADYGASHVVREVTAGVAPRLALNIAISWPEGPGAAREYSYEDTLSSPRLKVTNHRLIRYRLLEFEDQTVFDELEGLTGRPTSGALGLLFQIIGEGRVVEFRMAVAPSGEQISRGRAKKSFIEVATTVTVYPDGRSEKGVPADPALRALEERLKRPLAIRYQPRP
jgi:hypothetical protein